MAISLEIWETIQLYRIVQFTVLKIFHQDILWHYHKKWGSAVLLKSILQAVRFSSESIALIYYYWYSYINFMWMSFNYQAWLFLISEPGIVAVYPHIWIKSSVASSQNGHDIAKAQSLSQSSSKSFWSRYVLYAWYFLFLKTSGSKSGCCIFLCKCNRWQM